MLVYMTHKKRRNGKELVFVVFFLDCHLNNDSFTRNKKDSKEQQKFQFTFWIVQHRRPSHAQIRIMFV